METESKKIGEPSPQAIDFAKRMIALKWTKETNVDIVAGNWMAGYVHRQIEEGKSDAIDGWVNAETLPDKAGEYLCLTVDKCMNVFYFTKKRCFESKDFLTNDLIDVGGIVTHWRPLPQPPQSK